MHLATVKNEELSRLETPLLTSVYRSCHDVTVGKKAGSFFIAKIACLNAEVAGGIGAARETCPADHDLRSVGLARGLITLDFENGIRVGRIAASDELRVIRLAIAIRVLQRIGSARMVPKMMFANSGQRNDKTIRTTCLGNTAQGVRKETSTMKPTPSLASLESHLWETANILRGPVDAADFKTYVFPLLFFKRISDVHDEEYQTALTEADGDEEYAKFPQNYRFQIPDDGLWADVRKVATNVGQALQRAMRGIEKANAETRIDGQSSKMKC